MMLNWRTILTRAAGANLAPERRVTKSDVAWRQQLTPEQYWVTRQHGTESAFSSDMCGLFEPGLYACLCCGTTLFDASRKFESGTGWPSFTEPVAENVVAYRRDQSHGMDRVEVLCSTCDAHLGHVFPDGPEPSGLRFCMNAIALQKIKQA